MVAFNDIQEETQKKIVSAALEEFAEKGYDQASTNRIVKRAGVGKGMLYYYFKNKKELYLYLVENSLEAIEHEYINKIDLSETDFFERLQEIVEFKMKVYFKHSGFFNFMSQVLVMESSHLPDNLANRIDTLRTEGMGKLYQNVDYSRFRDDLDVEKTLQLIQWSLDGYANSIIERLKGIDFSQFEYESYHEEFMEYLEVLKKAFYQKKGDE
ncbi:TetR/AcrR family transcriptional regulator [Piscibacillus halophilus]|uniref:Transcriptional regulator, TetR family n=1 Tax=Piscibacillus halophilus TaxID=571933 RepID=A0A1H9KYD6_9BACI|nr:TetR/AcrR family transcriptional regulator [Piscibacillus halophilus]SER04202.1 transcriptional regulator, TetR family [Piscibacillus halophilus]